MSTRIDMDPRALLASRARKTKPAKQYGLTPRIRKAIGYIVFGDDAGTLPSSVAEAAKMAGITARSLNDALVKPTVVAHYKEQVRLLRDGHRPANVRSLAEIRDDPALKSSAAGARARVAAIAQLETDPDMRAGINVNVGVGVNVNVDERAGYVIDLSGHPAQPLLIEHDAEGLSDRVALDGPAPYEGAAAPLLASAGAKEGVGGKIRATSTSSSLAHATHPPARPRKKISQPPTKTPPGEQTATPASRH